MGWATCLINGNGVNLHVKFYYINLVNSVSARHAYITKVAPETWAQVERKKYWI